MDTWRVQIKIDHTILRIYDVKSNNKLCAIEEAKRRMWRERGEVNTYRILAVTRVNKFAFPPQL